MGKIAYNLIPYSFSMKSKVSNKIPKTVVGDNIDLEKKTVSRDSLLVLATQNAVTERRNELEARKLELIKFSGSLAQGMSEDSKWKSYSQICPHEVIELAEIEKELQIIDSLMIRTQKNFEKLGGQIKIEIRQSNIPDEVYESLREVVEN